MRQVFSMLALAASLSTPAFAQTAEEIIVFSSERSGNGDIYAVSQNGGDPVLVIGTEMPEGRPRFARDAGDLYYFLYQSDRPYLARDGAVIVDLHFFDTSPANSPDISPAGNELIYNAAYEDREAIFTQDFEPDAEKFEPELVQSYPTPRYPAYSPVGDAGFTYAYVNISDEGSSLRVSRSIVRMGQSPIQTLHTASYIGHPAWSADGSRIAFDVQNGDETDIAIVPAQGGDVQIIERPGNDFAPAFSSDGQLIAFGGVVDGDVELFTVSLETGEITRLTHSAGFDGGPVFVPASVLER